MVYTVTLSPALDLTYRTETVRGGGLLRAASLTERAGGKGVNVARALLRYGVPCTAAVCLGGATGARIGSLLAAEGIRAAVLPCPENSRTNVSVLAADGGSLEINAPGPAVETEAVERYLREHVRAGDTVCLCGSLPAGTPQDFYGRLTAMLSARGGVETVLDTSGEALRQALLLSPPSLIKPNLAELAALAEEAETSLPAQAADAAAYCASLAAKARVPASVAVLATLGRHGAVYLPDGGETRAAAACFVPAVPVSRVAAEKGAGDTFLAAFLAARQTHSVPFALPFAAAEAAAWVRGET